jgi:hypothetical protein
VGPYFLDYIIHMLTDMEENGDSTWQAGTKTTNYIFRGKM